MKLCIAALLAVLLLTGCFSGEDNKIKTAPRAIVTPEEGCRTHGGLADYYNRDYERLSYRNIYPENDYYFDKKQKVIIAFVCEDGTIVVVN